MDEILNFGNDIQEYSDFLKRIISTTKSLRSYKSGIATKWTEAAEWHMKYSNIEGVPSLSLTITLSPTGCEWARNGGCTMCGEFEGSFKRDELVENPQFHISQFVAAITNPQVWEAAHKEGKPIEWLRINQEGNYINPKEMNISSQVMILRLATHIKGIRKITIESRPQYITEQTASLLAEIFKNTAIELEIGMGVEAENDIVRNVCINKQESKIDFVRAVTTLRKYGIKALAYIIIKPPFLTEKEAIDEAVATAHFAKDIGFSRISLEPMTIHPYTLVDALSQTSDYKTPWLWSVVEVVKQCTDISYMLGIGGVGYYPIPNKYSHNYCEYGSKCNEQILALIPVYNRTRDTSVFDSVACECKNSWLKICRNTTKKSLKNRISEQMTHVELDLTNYTPSISDENKTVRNTRLIASGSQ